MRARISILGVALSIAGIVLSGLTLLVACRAVGETIERVGEATGIPALKAVGRAISSYEDLSASEEHYVGRSVSADIVSRYPVTASDGPSLYVERIGQALVALNPQVRQTFKGYRFSVLDSELVQAISAPGGFVFVSRGSLQRAENEDEVAAILAHEIAHVHLKHALQAIQKTRLLAAGQALAELAASELDKQKHLGEAGKALSDSVQDVSGTLIDRGFSRGFEEQADRLAVDLLKTAGYKPEALATYLDRLDRAGGSGGWFATHPSPEQRIAALKLDPAMPADSGVELRARRFRETLGR